LRDAACRRGESELFDHQVEESTPSRTERLSGTRAVQAMFGAAGLLDGGAAAGRRGGIAVQAGQVLAGPRCATQQRDPPQKS
jgi:hypothetical protein